MTKKVRKSAEIAKQNSIDDTTQTETLPEAFPHTPPQSPSYADATQTEAQPQFNEEAQIKEPKKGFCSCTIIEKYKKPMGVTVIILLLILNTIMVFVGIIQCYSSPCPIEPIIPIYLVGAGIVGLVSRIIFLVRHCRSVESIILNRILYGLLVAELIFLIIGSSWIFSNFKKKQYSCNGAAFTWAFLILIFYYLVLLSPLFIPCGIELYKNCFQHKMKKTTKTMQIETASDSSHTSPKF